MSTANAGAAGRLPAAEAIPAAGLLSYQDGAVVSRTLLKHPAGSVTMFAFDEGQGLSEHTSPFDAFVYLVEGGVEITVSGKPIVAKTGDLVLLPANEPHGLKATSRFKMMLTMLRS
ncbi:MAG TPA: cupin domain-containing protein [Candidatus Limnocylindrales bacterium]|nr:cupin domain-containing protein [Candidatus Limnocylindrales bacterium]